MFGMNKKQDKIEKAIEPIAPAQALSQKVMRQLSGEVQQPTQPVIRPNVTPVVKPTPIEQAEQSLEQEIVNALNLHEKYLISFDQRIKDIEAFIESHRSI